MSRHEIPARDPAHKVIVGWDQPMQTFFGQVINRKAEQAGSDDKFVLWVGCSLRELYEVEDLARALRRHVELAPQMRATLYGDKDEGR